MTENNNAVLISIIVIAAVIIICLISIIVVGCGGLYAFIDLNYAALSLSHLSHYKLLVAELLTVVGF